MSKPLLAGVPALLLASAALAQPSGDARPVMVILAHPDDELPMAPALSALARADEYWDLARSGGDPDAYSRSFAEDDRARIADEARTMVARFRELFPEHAA